jgi:creatinine amidohydrolase
VTRDRSATTTPDADPDPTRLAEHTTETATDRLADAEVALLPTGATEQHGPALPLGMDTIAAESIARELATSRAGPTGSGGDDGDASDGSDVVVLPTVPIGVSEHHRQFDGTLWVDPSTFEEYVLEVLAAVASHGVRKAVVVNGHGGNDAALARAGRRLRGGGTGFAAPWNWWSNLGDVHEDLFGSRVPGHAGAAETSVVGHLRPELVRTDRVADAEASAGDGSTPAPTGTGVDWDYADLSTGGATGSPAEWSPEAGGRLVDAALADLDALVDWLVATPLQELLPAPHR